MSTKKWNNPGEHQEKVEYVRVPGKGRIRASIEKLFRRVPKKGRSSVSTGKRKNPCEYRKNFWACIGKRSNQCEYKKMVESGRVPEKCRISVSTEKW